MAYLAFTERGLDLAARLQAVLGGSVSSSGAEGFSLSAWTREQFMLREALVYIGAAGIAVRAVAPCLKSKTEDPAVISLDEFGTYVIPLVSGHLGGANALSRRIAEICCGTAVISTATDLNGVFAVDLWAKKQGLCILRPERIKAVSSRLLAGGTVGFSCPWPIEGPLPKGVRLTDGRDASVLVGFRSQSETSALQLVPKVLTLGIGCRRGIRADQMEAAFAAFREARRFLPEAICGAASLDIKRDEAGLTGFCESHGWSLSFCTAADLRSLQGTFSGSAFVSEAVGVDNVCERAAVFVSGGETVEKKYASGGVTFALAATHPMLDWSF
ncbi:MAG: cobalamin biosynthesis protein [Oscillospiraceae bacterium]|nr:cobalamin biosynthesis protein [Oscillospiraceae bacterium]